MTLTRVIGVCDRTRDGDKEGEDHEHVDKNLAVPAKQRALNTEREATKPVFFSTRCAFQAAEFGRGNAATDEEQ